MFAFFVLLMINGSILLHNLWLAYFPTMRQVSMFWFYLSIPVGCILMGIFLTRNLVNTLKELNQERSSSAKASGKNSICSIGFILVSVACLVASNITYYS